MYSCLAINYMKTKTNNMKYIIGNQL